MTTGALVDVLTPIHCVLYCCIYYRTELKHTVNNRLSADCQFHSQLNYSKRHENTLKFIIMCHNVSVSKSLLDYW